MVNSISPRSGTGPVTDDPSWIYSDHGQNVNLTATLDLSLFSAAAHYPNGFIPSGLPLAKNSTTRMYGPVDPDAENGLEVLVGFLYSPLTVNDGLGVPTSLYGAVYTHGTVVEANLPAGTTLTADDKAAVDGRIQFI